MNIIILIGCAKFQRNLEGLLTFTLEQLRQSDISLRELDHGPEDLGLRGSRASEVRVRLEPQVRTWFSRADRTSSMVS